jgi:hypothetical protein
VHVEVFGSMNMPSLVDDRYFLLFVEEILYKMWDFFLKENPGALGAFRKLNVVVEK